MDSRTWNIIIHYVNKNVPVEEAQMRLPEMDVEIYLRLQKQLAELREKHPGTAFAPVETDW